jgi:hypothetical protein
MMRVHPIMPASATPTFANPTTVMPQQAGMFRGGAIAFHDKTPAFAGVTAPRATADVTTRTAA